MLYRQIVETGGPRQRTMTDRQFRKAGHRCADKFAEHCGPCKNEDSAAAFACENCHCPHYTNLQIFKKLFETIKEIEEEKGNHVPTPHEARENQTSLDEYQKHCVPCKGDSKEAVFACQNHNCAHYFSLQRVIAIFNEIKQNNK